MMPFNELMLPSNQDNVSHLCDEVYDVIRGLKIDWILPSSPDPGGPHSEAFGSIDVGKRVVSDEHDLLGTRESSRLQCIAEYLGSGLA